VHPYTYAAEVSKARAMNYCQINEVVGYAGLEGGIAVVAGNAVNDVNCVEVRSGCSPRPHLYWHLPVPAAIWCPFCRFI